jgi:hypothetical protein
MTSGLHYTARRRWFVRCTATVISGAALLAALAAPAQAATVTVGSPLTASFPDTFTGTDTEANGALGDSGANVTSPVNGTIVSWRLVVRGSGEFALRLLRPAAGGAYTGAGTSSRVTGPVGTQTFATSLPIKAGDLLGLDLVTPSSVVGEGSVVGSRVYEWGFGGIGELLADGSTAPPDHNYEGLELGFNAEVAPTNTFSLGATTKNKKKGTATLTFNLPNAGDLAGSGQGALVASTGAVTSKAVPAGSATLVVKAKGKKKRKLNEKGKVKLNLAVTFTPTGGDPGTQSVKVKLKKKKKT